HGQDLRRLSAVLSRTAHPGDAVYFFTRNSRAFFYAYPHGYRKLRDISLARNAVASTTLFGTNAGVPVIRRRLQTVASLWAIEASRAPHPAPALTGQGSGLAHHRHIHGIWRVRYVRLAPAALRYLTAGVYRAIPFASGSRPGDARGVGGGEWGRGVWWGGIARAAGPSGAARIKEDPQANLTDGYAFVGTKFNDTSKKVLNVFIHVRPFCEPGDGVIYDR